jgi:hypothetical protein
VLSIVERIAILAAIIDAVWKTVLSSGLDDVHLHENAAGSGFRYERCSS